MVNYSDDLDAVFRALADPTRRAVVNRLALGPASVKELAKPFEIGLPAFMKHVAVLEDSQLLTSRKIGRVRTCELATERLAEANCWFEEQIALWEGRTERLAAFVEGQQGKDEK